ncbi:hypothetical protein SAICODRAFT_8072 [Saitoella complicata NRRL Y-17804]|uniref:3-beta hydroxysteroid dehydrogenase/isomerase domain-containing protein n=1 Tax=Saitoella complicata (strain BCRC 22490 / CBS 7301 / JCM 7358 / NBRC 10748 / NRRL Y-17804) TaxID=698492 RepID=A0A0E9N974_SAICN|nr:uncharacterized protein SAICODRAFT_8072 [Saitoella complicata NRRL Y-17804]ODQ52242.1 hypothetical protein SAICODRAFT_8072 [Saitoella complicata NRRL Y-17804]GAO45950.1 hypothetical protein G7K_0195-t1 [Saitoella complicata NRRL Y-17804]
MSTKKYNFNSALVIGGCGFLGGHIVSHILDSDPSISISVMDLRIPNTPPHPSVAYHAGDITSLDDMTRIIQSTRPDVIIHTASPVHGMGRDIYFKVNVEGTRTICRAAKAEGVKAMVFTSSAGVVFDGDDLINVDESAPIPVVAMDAYNDSKAEAEKLALGANCDEFRVCAIRPAGLFGEGDRQLIPGMLSVLANGQTHFQLGDNLNLFDFTYILNAAHAHLLAANQILSPDPSIVSTVAGEAFFITNASPIYFWDFPRTLWSHLSHVSSRHLILPRSLAVVLAGAAECWSWIVGKEPGFTRFRVKFSCANRYYNIGKARRVLGYEPIVGLEEGIRRSLAWVDEEKAKEGK